ncbi:hypothetical protein GLT81_00020 [Nanohaloarchaea archaeon]|nr:hypothetical protein [Candidatus Nanohaloarchaea archaeon]
MLWYKYGYTVSEVNYKDLDGLQKQALIDAFGEPSKYETPLFSEADVTEVGEYSNLRTKLEGLNVERGNIGSERFDYFTGENGNILRETSEGEYEVNSIWDSWMLEEMEEKGMIDSSQFSFYKAENLEDTGMSVLEVDGSFYLDIEDGVTFSLGSAETVEDAEYDSAEKVQHMTEDFIKQFACEEGEEPGDTGYINDISSKPKEGSHKIEGGEKQMSQLEQVYDALNSAESQLDDLRDVDPSAVGAKASEFDAQVDAARNQIEEAISRVDDYREDAESAQEAVEVYSEVMDDVETAINGISSQVGGISEELDEEINQAESQLRDAYGSLQEMVDGYDVPSYSGPSDQVMDAIEDTTGEGSEERVERIEEIADRLSPDDGGD